MGTWLVPWLAALSSLATLSFGRPVHAQDGSLDAGVARADAGASDSGADAARGRLTRPPRVTRPSEPVYPASEIAARTDAVVVLSLSITATGDVADARVVESGGAAFDEAALTAARGLRFEPAEIDGAPAPIRILYRYEIHWRAPERRTATLRGLVRDAASRAPIAGVTVSIDGAGGATSGADGRFHVEDVAPGRRTITLSGDRLTAVQTEETFEAGRDLEATYDVAVRIGEPTSAEERDDLELIVRAPAVRLEVVATSVRADQARRVPGASGDVLRVVESMPGVGRAAAGSAGLVVWGAAPEDTRTLVDGVPIPRLYHSGGLRSVVGSDLVRAVELIPGGYGAAYGRGLGGLVLVETGLPESERRVAGNLSIDPIDAGGALRVPLSRRLAIAVGARRSHVDTLLPLVADDDVEDYFPIPRYWDAQARATWRPSARDVVEVTGLVSSDRTSRASPNADPARATRERRDLVFHRTWVRWQRSLADGTEISVTPWGGQDHALLDSVYGSTVTRLETTSFQSGLRASWRSPVRRWLWLDAGLDVEVAATEVSRRGSISAPAREGDVRIFGQAPPDRIDADRFDVVTIGLAPWVQADVALLAGKLHLIPGLRFDPSVRSVSRQTPVEGNTPSIGLFAQEPSIEPRAAVRWDPTEWLSLRSGFGLYAQSAFAADLSAAFGNPTLPPSRGWHLLAGATVRPREGLSFELTGFVTTSRDLAVRSPVESPLRARALEPLGRGRAFGGQLLARLELGRNLFGWVSYGLVRSERKNGEGDWRPFDQDQTHVLTALGSWRIGFGFEVGFRVRYATGFPRTAVVDSFLDARRDTWQPVFGRQNGIRLADFFQLDVRASRTFSLGPTELEIYLEVQNTTNHENTEEWVYSTDLSERRAITGFPILPLLGARWAF